MSEEILQVEISEQPIALCKLLKIANLVAGGGEAKILISSGYVILNQQVEYQKRKKVYHRDLVECHGEVIQVICENPVSNEASIKSQKKTPSPSKKPKKFNNGSTHTAETISKDGDKDKDKNKPKRKPISF